MDASAEADAMPAEDAATPADAFVELDAMPIVDAAIAVDAFVELDAGSDLDAGREESADGGPVPVDAGTDAGPLRDAGRPDAQVPGTDAGPGACSCQRSTSCSDLGPFACGAGFGVACGDGRRVPACPRETALYWCEGPFEGVTYYDRYFGNSATLEASCVSGGHTFVTRTPPAPSGAACSCRRTAGACAETYGVSCASLSCDAPVAGPCDTSGATPGRCVSLDGQLRATFYGASRADAERACRDLGSEFYWVP